MKMHLYWSACTLAAHFELHIFALIKVNVPERVQAHWAFLVTVCEPLQTSTLSRLPKCK